MVGSIGGLTNTSPRLASAAATADWICGGGGRKRTCTPPGCSPLTNASMSVPDGAALTAFAIRLCTRAAVTPTDIKNGCGCLPGFVVGGMTGRVPLPEWQESSTTTSWIPEGRVL